MSKGRNLLDNGKLLDAHPDLSHLFSGVHALYGSVAHAKRLSLGISQKVLAEKVGVSIKVIAKVEGGNNTLAPKYYSMVFSELGLSMSELVETSCELTNKEQAATIAH